MKRVPPSFAPDLRPVPFLIAPVIFLIAFCSAANVMVGPGGALAAGLTFTVDNTNDSGTGSLRQAILDANTSPGPDIIAFNIPGVGVHTISPLSPLPPITDPVVINGYTQPGASPNMLPAAFDATILIELNGANAGAGADGLSISPGDSLVRGLKISGFSFSGIVLQDGGGNRVEGNIITGNSSRGVNIIAGSSNNVIGGVTPDARNVISSNGSQGVRILVSANANLVQGNFIGVNAAGTGAAGNVNEGIFLNSSNNVIGGVTPGARNVISGSLNASGLSMTGPGATGNVVQGNFIGTDASGAVALGNKQEGILIDLSAAGNTIGGTSGAGGNVISGNGQNGIVMGFTSAVNGNQIQGNFIGTRADGVSPLGNGQDGISLVSGSNNSIGDLAGNVIAFNADAGVIVSAGTGNLILSNSIFSNGDLGIDLGADGVTPNDTCDLDAGANGLQNSPVLTASSFDGSNVTVDGTFNGAPNAGYLIHFYANDACDATGFGEGKLLIGSAAIATDGSCNAVFSVTLPVAAPPAVITANVTDSIGNTSEFSACLAGPACAITCPPDIKVSTPANGTLCGIAIAYSPPQTIGDCALAVCVPPPGSFFPVGATTVSCSTLTDQPGIQNSCSFTVEVVDDTPPVITCPGDASVVPEPGQMSRAVSYPSPQVSDNCQGALKVACNPPSGSSFPVGTTTVTCLASDASDNVSSCSFKVSVAGAQPLAVACPASVVTQADAAECTAVVTFPPAVMTAGPVGTIIACVPPSGSAFPVGTSGVTCTATAPTGESSTCSFTVTVNAAARAAVTLEGGGTALDFGPASPARRAKKSPPRDCDCSRAFTIENTGCAVLRLDLAEIRRTGRDVDGGKITDTDDSAFFSVTIVNPDGSERPARCDDGPPGCISIEPGQRLTFRVVFKPVIPAAFSEKTEGLSASEVLPDLITSRVVFTQANGPALEIDLTGRIATAIKLVNPDNPRRQARAIFTRAGDEFSVTFAAFDSDLDASRARYEFLDGQGRQVGAAIDVDITQAISASGLVRGQGFILTQRFSGAAANPEVAAVRVTVSDSGSSDFVTASLRR
jgi:hypothetical protein